MAKKKGRKPSRDGKGKGLAKPSDKRKSGGGAGSLGLAELSEVELRKTILVPLFERLGYRDVTDTHSAIELGKDIVMWRPEGLVSRANYAVVAKRGPISGRANGAQSTAATTAYQIRQALGSAYPDPRTGAAQWVSTVFVVASGTISHQAQNAIASSLSPLEQRAVQYIDGAELDRLVRAHLGDRTALAKAAEIRAAIKELNSPLDIGVSITDAGVHVTLTSRSDGGPVLEGKIVLAANDPDEAKQTQDLLKEHFQTGAPVILPGAKIDAPELIKVMTALGFDPGAETKVAIQATQGRELSMVFRLRIDDEERQIGPIRCRASQVGTEEITLVSTAPARGWTVKCVLRPQAGQVNLVVNCRYEGLSATACCDGLLTTALLARGPELVIEEFDRGLHLGTAKLDAGLLAPPDPDTVRVMEAAAFIERTKQVTLPVPPQGISVAEAAVILESAQLLKGETIEGTWKKVEGVATRNSPELLEQFKNLPGGVLTVRQTMTLNLFGRRIDLGERESTLHDARVARTDMRRALAAHRVGAYPISIVIRPRRAPGKVSVRLMETSAA